jgi:hypothetical protein
MTAPIEIDRLVKELEKLKTEMDAGRLRHSEYDQRLARVIGELRERKLDTNRPELNATLDDLLKRGVITPSVREHLQKRLGL